jgi:4-hydroxyproline epimerase
VIIAGGPDLGTGDPHGRLRLLREQHGGLRIRVVFEPRGSEVIVGALLCEPVDSDHVAGVIFFNDVGSLGMCGHGTIGLMTTLAYLGRIGLGKYDTGTPVGVVRAKLHVDGSVPVQDIPSYYYREGIAL